MPDNRVVSYTYYANGNLTSVTPPFRPAHGFGYTPVDLVSNYTPPDVAAGANVTTYQYNFDRQPTLITCPDGQTIDCGYNSAGRLGTITTPSGPYTYGYDSAGRVDGISAPGGLALGYTYDGSLPLSATWTGPINASVSRALDSDFRIVSESENGGSTVGFTYDNDSLLTSAGTLTLTRDPQNGLLTGTTLGVVSDSLTYNSFGEPTDYTTAISGSPILSVTYTRDKLGRIETKDETIQGVTDSYVYSYDPAGHLSDVTRNGSLISHYEYDLNGNRLSQAMSGSTVSYTYDDQDRLLQTAGPSPQLSADYTYTANGELLTKTVGTDTTTYNYDVQGNLMAVTLPNGMRVEYILDP